MIDPLSSILSAAEAAYPPPYRLHSDDTRDLPVLARWAPGERKTIQYAAGVAHDLRGKVGGALTVSDATGATVPPHILREVLALGRLEHRGAR